MYGHHYHDYPHYPYGGVPHGGLMGVFGGVIGLTTASLQAGARVVRTIVEGSVWHGCHGYHDDCCHYDPYCGHHVHHCYHVECRPHSYPCCGCC